MVLLVEEILHQLICGLSHFLQGFIDPRWLFGISSIYSINHKTNSSFLLRSMLAKVTSGNPKKKKLVKSSSPRDLLKRKCAEPNPKGNLPMGLPTPSVRFVSSITISYQPQLFQKNNSFCIAYWLATRCVMLEHLFKHSKIYHGFCWSKMSELAVL